MRTVAFLGFDCSGLVRFPLVGCRVVEVQSNVYHALAAILAFDHDSGPFRRAAARHTLRPFFITTSPSA